MTEEYIAYQQAVTLKECGFDWECNRYYIHNNETLRWHYPADNMNEANDFYSAPRLWSAQKWLREVKGIALNVDAHDGGLFMWEAIFLPNAVSCEAYIAPDIEQYPTYEAALSAGIDAALELIKVK